MLGRKWVSVCLILLCSAAVHANVNENHFYISLQGGGAFLPKEDSTVSIFKSKRVWKTGYNAFGAVGYKMNMLRFEIEFGYSKSDIKSYDFEPFPIDATLIPIFNGLVPAGGTPLQNGDTFSNSFNGLKGNKHLYRLMANFFVDIPINKGFVPYVGAGLGYGRIGMEVTADDFFMSFPAASGIPTNRIGAFKFKPDSYNIFILQGALGFKIIVSDNVDLVVDGRYIVGTKKLKSQWARNFVNNFKFMSVVDNFYQNYSVNAGIVLKF